MNKKLLVNEDVIYQKIGEEISLDLGAKMVKNHQDSNTEDTFTYYVGKDIIERILAQPGCVGMRFFDAINEEGIKTLVYVGIDSKGKSLLEITSVNEHGKLAVTPGMLGDKSVTGPFNSWFGN